MKTLLVIKTITVYSLDKVLFRIRKGATIQGKFDGLIGGYICEKDGVKYLAFHHEVVVC
jgi:hypothetical protein